MSSLGLPLPHQRPGGWPQNLFLPQPCCRASLSWPGEGTVGTHLHRNDEVGEGKNESLEFRPGEYTDLTRRCSSS